MFGYNNTYIASLNPCCNGIYLIIATGHPECVRNESLNPCCNGIYLIIEIELLNKRTICLNPCCNGIYLIIVKTFFPFV